MTLLHKVSRSSALALLATLTMVATAWGVDPITLPQIGPPTIKGGGTPPNNGGTGTSTTYCPDRLVGRVEDVDGSGNLICRYKIFITSNCTDDERRVDLPCSVERSPCSGNSCPVPHTSVLIPVSPPDLNAASQDIGQPPPPADDPITIPGFAKAFASDAMSGGVAPIPAGNTRTIVPVGATTTATTKYATYPQPGGDKHFKLIRIEVTEPDGSKITIGSGFQIPSIPAGETVVPSNFRQLQSKTYQVEEYSNTNNVEWTYIVHENQ
jgi:hypothetical protein